MASTNQSPKYQKAEAKFLSAQTDKERLNYLEEMIRECPKHKSAEKMLAQLKQRYKKLKERLEKGKKSKSSSKSVRSGIKKQEMQAVILGATNTGKSSLLSKLTNSSPEINPYGFTTKSPEIGILNYAGTQIQLIEIPPFESEYYDKGIVNSADTIILVIDNLEQIQKIEKELTNQDAKKIIVLNKIDLLSNEQKRKFSSTLASKKYDFVLISLKTEENIENLKEKIFKSFGKIRVYTKEPGKNVNPREDKPIVLSQNSTVENAAEKILHGFSKKIKQTKIWGPSSKFPGQIVGLKHILKDLDIVEFKTN